LTPSCTELWQRNRRDLSVARERAAEATKLLEGECAVDKCITEELKKRRQQTRSKLRRALERVDFLTVQCRDIESIASAEHDQIDAYGQEQWHTEFIRFRDIKDDTERQQLWRLLGQSRFVRFQQIFCNRDNRIIPRHEKHNLTYHFPGKSSNVDNLPLHACLVNPDRMSDELTEKLNLATLKKGDSHLEKLQKKYEGIPRLKEIFQNASRLATGNERFLIIHDEDQDIDGQLLYIREKPHNPVDKEIRIYPDAYAAYRKTDHQREGYGEETGVIGSIVTRVRTFNGRMNECWQKSAPEEEKDALVLDAADLHSSCMAHLANVINQHKVRARDLLDQMQNLTFETKSGKHVRNPSASMAKMVAIMNALEKRFMEMRGKSRANEDDHILLARVIADHKETIRGIDRRLCGVHKYWQSRRMINWQMDDMMANIERCLWPRVFKDLRVQPFRRIGFVLQEIYDRLSEILKTKDRSAFLNLLETMQHSIQTFYNEPDVQNNLPSTS